MAKTFMTKRSSSDTDLSSLIAKKAYELWEKRGRQPGRAMDDW